VAFGSPAVSTAGPPQRLAELFEEAGRLVHRTARRITGSAEDAEDVVQAVFLHLMKTCPPAPWPDNPPAYLHRATVNASLDLLRKRKRRPEAPLEYEVAEDRGRTAEESLVSAIGSERDAGRVRDAMGLLSPLEAEMFSLRYLEEKDNAEIAEALGKTANHVRVTLHSARKKLRDHLTAPAESAVRGDAQ
jgi:RNA polymerase sigma-70 factor (ECF subfamily)